MDWACLLGLDRLDRDLLDAAAAPLGGASTLARRRGREAKLAYSAHALMENRNGLLVGFFIDEANGNAERKAALALVDETTSERPRTLGADKAYDTRDFVAACRERGVTPHVAQNVHARRRSSIDARTTRHPGYATAE